MVLPPNVPSHISEGYFTQLFLNASGDDLDEEGCSILLHIHMLEFLEDETDDLTVMDIPAVDPGSWSKLIPPAVSHF